ncbi:MAG TPA: PD-(D/E)XK nuclease family protein [Lacunisphaera sp.]|nr:PD-(D/E)XK nuclease family protein [Lacunisphaera sp.]
MGVSASSAHRVDLCPPSAVLAQVEHESEAADSGSALHEHITDRARLGVDDAVARLDAVMAKWNLSPREAAVLRSRLVKFEWSPPAGALTEIRLALMQDGTVRRVPPEARHYPGSVITGQFDVLWSEPEPLIVSEDGTVLCPEGSVLWVIDLKGGLDSWVPTIETNFQVHIYAFLAAVWTKARRVLPGILYPLPGEGDWDVVERPWGQREIEAVGARIHAMFARVDAEREKAAKGLPLALLEGRHCEYCPAHSRCPAKTAMVKSVLAEDGELVPNGEAPLSADEARRAAIAYGQIGQFHRRLRELLESYVHSTGKPIDIGDGLVYGPKAETKTKIITRVAREVLDRELGEFAPTAMQITGSSIERAVKEKLAGARGVSPAVKRLYALIGEAGGLVEEERSEWTVHRPEPGALPPIKTQNLEQTLAESVDSPRFLGQPGSPGAESHP